MSKVHITCVVLVLCVACKTRSEDARVKNDLGSAAVDAAIVADYRGTLNRYLQSPSVAEGWDWFMYHSHTFKALPMVLVKLLPELDPDIWGKPEEKFSRFGHFVLPGDENRALPSSMGMATFPTKSDPTPLILTTETCGTCHMGRVRISSTTADSTILNLYGGVNNQFDIRRWRTALEQTVEKYLKDGSAINKTATKLRTIIRSKPQRFFDSNLAQDTVQREFFTRAGGAESILHNFVKHAATFTRGKHLERSSSYKIGESNPPNIDQGHPGQVDASGDLVSQLLLTTFGMPAKASLTDIPSVWLQSEYAVGQWDGSLGNQYIRNLAAEIAVAPTGGVDRRVAHYALQFVTELPAPKFPFLSDHPQNRAMLVEKGQRLFQTNCADCHSALNTRVYPEVATDMNRAKVITKIGGAAVAKAFYDACHTDLPDGTSPPSCGAFTKYLLSPDPKIGPGYTAKPLTGIWARAPYLHNGSVPTLRHLLLPSTRPADFVVGSLNYDTKNIGYAWDMRQLESYHQIDPQVDVLNTHHDGLSNKGHDQAILKVDSKTYRLDWTPEPGDDPDSIEALLEYLKTL